LFSDLSVITMVFSGGNRRDAMPARAARAARGALGRQVSALDPNLLRTTVAYDAAGEVTTQIDGAGDTTTMIYDAARRLGKKRGKKRWGKEKVSGPFSLEKEKGKKGGQKERGTFIFSSANLTRCRATAAGPSTIPVF
jgi:YD repeat-containing protein